MAPYVEGIYLGALSRHLLYFMLLLQHQLITATKLNA